MVGNNKRNTIASSPKGKAEMQCLFHLSLFRKSTKNNFRDRRHYSVGTQKSQPINTSKLEIRIVFLIRPITVSVKNHKGKKVINYKAEPKFYRESAWTLPAPQASGNTSPILCSQTDITVSVNSYKDTVLLLHFPPY